MRRGVPRGAGGVGGAPEDGDSAAREAAGEGVPAGGVPGLAAGEGPRKRPEEAALGDGTDKSCFGLRFPSLDWALLQVWSVTWP